MSTDSVSKRVAQLRIDHAAIEARQAPRRRARVAISVVLAGAVVAVGWVLLSPKAVAVLTAPAQQRQAAGGMKDILTASGYVTPRRLATVSSKFTGKLQSTFVQEGSTVTTGQVLARLDDTLLRGQVELAEAQLAAARRAPEETEVQIREAQANLDRMHRLLDEGIVSPAELDRAKAGLESLRARLAHGRDQAVVAERQLELKRRELEDTIIRAPFGGVVTSRNAQPGEIVSPVSAGGGFTRTGICTIVDMDSLEIVVDVNEGFISRVTPGQKAVVVADAFPDLKLAAHVLRTVPAAERNTATVRVHLALDRPDRRLLANMGVKATFLADAARNDSSSQRQPVVVMEKAVRQEQDEAVVYVVVSGRLDRRRVETGRTDAGSVEILSGVAPGELVVVEGPEQLAHGARVRQR